MYRSINNDREVWQRENEWMAKDAQEGPNMLRLWKRDKKPTHIGHFTVTYITTTHVFQVLGPKQEFVAEFKGTGFGHSDALAFAYAADKGYTLALSQEAL